MSDPEMDRLLKEMSDLVDQAELQAHLQNLQQLISMHQEAEPSTSQPSTRQPSNSKQDVRWIKRDSDGNIIYGRPRSSRKQAGVGKSAFIGKSHSGGKDDLVLQYVVNNSLREHPVLTKLRLRTLEDQWSRMMVASEQAQLMANLIRLINATKAIEIGMYTGYNALSMALAMPENGRVVACEIEDAYVEIAKPFFKEAGVENKIDIQHQTAMKTLDELITAGEAGTYDFVFIDADKSNYDGYYEKSLELIRKGGIIAIDNVLWSGKVVNPAPTDLTSQVLDALNKKLHKDQRIELSMLTVGDGLTIAIKR